MPILFLPHVAALLFALVFLGSLPIAQTVDVHQAQHTTAGSLPSDGTTSIDREAGGTVGNGDGAHNDDDGDAESVADAAASSDHEYWSDFMSDYTEELGLLVLTKENVIPAVGGQLETSKYGADAVLVLFFIYSPDCPHCAPVMRDLEAASEKVSRAWHGIASSDAWGAEGYDPPPRPLLAKLDGTVLDSEFLTNFEPVQGYPTLKFGVVMLDEDGVGDGDEKDEGEDENDTLIDVFEYIGPLDDPADFAGSVLYYWYRFVGARRMALELMSSREFDNDDGGEVNVYVEYNVPVFVVPSDSDLVSFVVEHGFGFLRPAPPHLSDHMGGDEREHVLSLLKTSDEDDPDLVEPLTLFVQCRLGTDDAERWGSESNIYSMFDDLAEEMANRRDVAFFAIDPPPGHRCSVKRGWFVGKGDDNEADGSVAVIRLRNAARSSKGVDDNGEVDWVGFDVKGDEMPLYVHKSPTDDNAGDAKMNLSTPNLTLTQFIVCQSTPTLLWFDRVVMAPYAFPIYRKIHAVLFIDLHHVGKHAPKRDHTTSQSRAAVKLFRKAAIDHRRRRPMDDVVFLVVPSTEVRVMTTFGIDMWTGLDDAFVAGIDGEQSCTADDIVLPTVMLTSRAGPGGDRSLKRYYLPASDILLDLEGEGKGILDQFIRHYFEGKLIESIQSQAEPTNRTNESGVQQITGNSFKSLVLDQDERHTLVHFYSPTCGHCKRFAVVWNELSRLIKALHWDTVVDVMKMDLTKNEVSHDGLRIWDFPSVYYFPAKEKGNAARMDVEGDAEIGENNLGGIHSAYDLVEWLVRQGKLDEHELLRLHETGSLKLKVAEEHTKIHTDGEDATKASANV